MNLPTSGPHSCIHIAVWFIGIHTTIWSCLFAVSLGQEYSILKLISSIVLQIVPLQEKK